MSSQCRNLDTLTWLAVAFIASAAFVFFGINKAEAANPYIQNVFFGQDENSDYISFDWVGVPPPAGNDWFSCRRDIVAIWFNRFNPSGANTGNIILDYVDGDFVGRWSSYSGFGSYAFASGLPNYNCATNNPDLSQELPRHFKVYINPLLPPERFSFTGNDFITIQLLGWNYNAQFIEVLAGDTEEYNYQIPENPLPAIPYTNVKFGFNGNNQLNVSFDWIGPSKNTGFLVGFNGQVHDSVFTERRFTPDTERDVSMTWEQGGNLNFGYVDVLGGGFFEKGNHYELPVKWLEKWTPTQGLKTNCIAFFWWLCGDPISKGTFEDFLGRGLNPDDYITITSYFNDPSKYYFEPLCEGLCITNINPKSGAPGISLTIEGNNFSGGFGLFNYVFFGLNAAEIIEWGNNKIVVKVPPGTGEVDVRVSALTSESNKVLFTYNKPFINALQSETGDIRTQVKIHGSDFGIKGLSSLFGVKFGKSNALTTAWEDNEIQVKSPSDYGTGENDRNFLVCLLLVATPNTEWFSIPEKCLVWLGTLALNGIYIDPVHGAIDVGVKVITPAGESNTKTFTYQLLPLAIGDLNSPGELRVYDSQGRVSGMVSGEIQEEIPTSLYDSENEIVAIPRANGQYSYEVVGTGNDTYGLNLVFAEQATTTIFKAIDIPTKVGEVHKYYVDWETIRLNGSGVTLQVDADGDGIFEKKVITNSTLTQNEFILQTGTNIDIVPDVLNLKSTGNVITAYIELPHGFAPDKIDTSTIMLNGIIPSLEKPVALGDYDNDGVADLMVKFDREKVKQLFMDSGEKTEVQVAGSILHNNEYLKFAGTDYIKLIK